MVPKKKMTRGPFYPSRRPTQIVRKECAASPNGKHSFVLNPNFEPPNIGSPKPQVKTCEWCGENRFYRTVDGKEIEVRI